MEHRAKNIRETLLCLQDLSSYEKKFITDRVDFIQDVYQAQFRLENFMLSISVKHKKPKIGEIRFSYDDLSKYNALKQFTGDYGFVVPTMGSKTKKILRGEKRLKYS